MATSKVSEAYTVKLNAGCSGGKHLKRICEKLANMNPEQP